MDLSINTQLTTLQKVLLPICTPYSIRRLEKDNLLSKVIGVVELCPGISLIASIIEMIAHRCFKKSTNENEGKQNIHGEKAHEIKSPEGTSKKVAIVANKEIFMQHITSEDAVEIPQRVEAIEKALREAHLMDTDNTLKPRKASDEEIAL